MRRRVVRALDFGGFVVYVGLEADALSLRWQAIEEQGFDLANVYVIRATDPISPTIGRDGRETPSVGEAALTTALRELAESLARDGRPPIVALMVDTVRASMAGSEDSSSDASSYLRAVRRILRVIEGAAAILGDHPDGRTATSSGSASAAVQRFVDPSTASRTSRPTTEPPRIRRWFRSCCAC